MNRIPEAIGAIIFLVFVWPFMCLYLWLHRKELQKKDYDCGNCEKDQPQSLGWTLSQTDLPIDKPIAKQIHD